MKKWPLILAACALLLAGCAHFDKADCRQCAVEGFDPRVARTPNPLLPNVFVVGRRYLVVDQEPIRINKSHVDADGRVTIAWALPAGTPYEFVAGDKGIVIVPVPQREGATSKDRVAPKVTSTPPKCERSPQGKVVTCTLVVLDKSVFKYTINVVNPKGEKVEPLDPFIEGNY